jgi:hypothetical protein
MLWDDEHLYVAAEMEESNVRATQAQHDSTVYFENDFEVFIDPEADSCDYFEIEINARNTVFDLMLNRPYREGGKAQRAWNAVGLRSAVSIDGTLNDASDRDRGWSVEMAIPWRALVPTGDGKAPPETTSASEPRDMNRSWLPGQAPRPGDVWRINLARVQWPEHIALGSWALSKQADNWAWSPHGEVNMHIPERWGCVRFIDAADRE